MDDSYHRFFRLILLLSIAFLVVAFGQPAWVPLLGLVAAVVGYALVWLALLNLAGRTARFAVASTWFAGVQMVQLGWMTSDTLQGSYVYGMWLFFSLALGLQFGLLSLLIRPPRQMTLFRLLCIPAAWTLLEWSRLYFLIGFTWNPVGLALSGYLIPAQGASIAGVLGLSFWVMLVNACSYCFLGGRDLSQYLRARYALGATALALTPYLYGGGHLLYHLHHPSGTFNALLVQTGLGPDEINGYIFPRKRLPALEQWARILALVAERPRERVDLVVLPEGALPFTSSAETYSYDLVEALFIAFFGGKGTFPPAGERVSNAYMCQLLADALHCDVVGGFDTFDEETGVVYNAALLFHPGGREGQLYAKRRLLPIAETIPYRWLRPLARRYGITASFSPGEEAVLFETAVPMGVTICYEETMADLARESRKKGCQALLNISTDGWFPHSKLPMQHFSHGRVRALENGVPLLRACHTGVTAVVDSLGRTLGQIGDWRGRPESKSGVLFVRVPKYEFSTLYVMFGNVLPVGASALILLVFVARRWGAFRRKD